MPLPMLLMRSILLVLSAHAVAPFIDMSSVFVLTSVFVLLSIIVYFDALCFWRDPLNRAAGFLLPSAIAVYVNFRDEQTWPADSACQRTLQLIPYWAADVSWAALSSVGFVSLYMQVPLRVRILTMSIAWLAWLWRTSC
jgi:hypothetical protein